MSGGCSGAVFETSTTFLARNCPICGIHDSGNMGTALLPALTVSDSCQSSRMVSRRASNFVSSKLLVAVDNLEVSDLMGLVATDWTGESMLDRMEFESLRGLTFPSSSSIGVE